MRERGFRSARSDVPDAQGRGLLGSGACAAGFILCDMLRPVQNSQYFVCQQRHLPVRNGILCAMHDRTNARFGIGMQRFDLGAHGHERLE